jgi:hypothetical protein
MCQIANKLPKNTTNIPNIFQMAFEYVFQYIPFQGPPKFIRICRDFLFENITSSNPALMQKIVKAVASSRIDFTKFHFGRKYIFQINFHPQILDRFPPKKSRYKFIKVLWTIGLGL